MIVIVHSFEIRTQAGDPHTEFIQTWNLWAVQLREKAPDSLWARLFKQTDNSYISLFICQNERTWVVVSQLMDPQIVPMLQEFADLTNQTRWSLERDLERSTSFCPTPMALQLWDESDWQDVGTIDMIASQDDEIVEYRNGQREELTYYRCLELSTPAQKAIENALSRNESVYCRARPNAVPMEMGLTVKRLYRCLARTGEIHNGRPVFEERYMLAGQFVVDLDPRNH